MRLVAGAASDVGQLRSLNEDSVLVGDGLFAVADGMGGHRGGDVASALALEAFSAAAAEEHDVDSMMTAVRTANRAVFDHAQGVPDLAGMGTTLCAVAALDDSRVAVVNVGDSRVYVLRGGRLAQISEDHSFVESLVREGRLTRAQADVHPQRNVLTRALGIEPLIDVDGWAVEVAEGDRFLLCSDGLFNEVTDPSIETMLPGGTPGEAAARLVAAANEHGGRDNISCVVVDVVDLPPAAGDTDMPTPAPVLSLTRHGAAADLDETTVDVPDASGNPVPPPSIPAGSQQRARRFTWRTAAFLLAVVLVLAVPFGFVTLKYRDMYSVGVDAREVVIYKGPSKKVLWITPTVVDQSGLYLTDLSDAGQNQVKEGIEDLTRSAADERVAQLRKDAERMSTTSTTTTTTTTSTTTTTTTTTTAAPAPPPAPPASG